MSGRRLGVAVRLKTFSRGPLPSSGICAQLPFTILSSLVIWCNTRGLSPISPRNTSLPLGLIMTEPFEDGLLWPLPLRGMSWMRRYFLCSCEALRQQPLVNLTPPRLVTWLLLQSVVTDVEVLVTVVGNVLLYRRHRALGLLVH